MKFPRLLAMAVAACAALPLAAPVRAAPLDFLFQFEVTSVVGVRQDLLGSILTGDLTIDDADLDGAGDGTIGGADMMLEIVFSGQSLFESNDIDFPDYPEITFEGFAPTNVNIVFVEGASGVAFVEPQVVELVMVGDVVFDAGVYYGEAFVESAAIPLPAALPLSLAALGGLGALRLRRRKG